MKNLKTSNFICMHMKNVFFFMLFLTLSLKVQNVEIGKWDQFKRASSLVKKKHIKNYFLIKTEPGFLEKNQLLNDASVCRILDDTHFIIESTLQNIASYPDIKYTEANNLWKLSITHIKDPNTTQLFNIKTSNPSLLIEDLRSGGIKITRQNQSMITIKANLTKVINKVLPLDHVAYVSNECLQPVQESIVNDLDLSINGIFKMLQLYPEFKGQGQTIGVKDNLPDSNDIDLLSKIKDSSIASNEVDTHATDMATIISGAGNSGLKGLGVVPESVVFPMDFNNLFPDDFQVLDQANVSLINNSYGTTIENYYGLLAEAYDQFVYDNPTILHVFSSGNSGNITSDNGVYESIPGYANLTGNFKMSKNCITVGAHDKNNIVLPFSSKGPAYDGRLKPEIVAYSIIGTSNAAALVTGTASILQQAYFKNENELPPSSLIKAALLNGANDIGRPGIDFETGYGSLNTEESLEIINSGNYLVDTIESNEIKNFSITVPEDIIDLKVMLVWTDMPALPNDNKALKNNLDITLNNGQTTFFPSVLNTNPTIENLESVANIGVDVLNPMEQILIPNPIAGNYILSVKAGNLESFNQEFSLVYTWKNRNSLKWVYPVLAAKFPYLGGDVGYVRWHSYFEQSKFARLEVSLDNMNTWETLADEVDLSIGFYEWELPNNLHSEAHLRFDIDGESEISERFVISTGVNIETTLNCEDVAEITWSKKENTSEYHIFNLLNDEMELIASTTDTSFAFSKEVYTNPYFSVSPVLDSGIESLGSETVNVNAFSERCYFDYVFAFLEDEKIKIDVSLSSIFNIKSIEGFRVNTGASLTQVLFVEAPDTFDFKIENASAIDGINTYQFKIVTNDGATFFSQETSVRYFSEQNPFLVFPNPTTLEKGITIYSGLPRNEIASFDMFDLNGRLVLSEILTSDVAFVPLDTSVFSEGMYVYTISGKTVKTKFTQKIVIE